MPNQLPIILSISALLVLNLQAQAVTVHTWKDASGVTHFSDEPGPAGTQSNRLVFDDIEKSATSEQEDFYSIANQWKRLKAERDLAKTRQLEKRKLQSAERDRLAALALQGTAPETHGASPAYPIFGPGIRNGFANNRFQPGYGLPSHGRASPGRFAGGFDRQRANRQVPHPNYNSPFHDRAQPQSVRPTPSRRSVSSNRQHRSAGYGQRNRAHSGGGLFVRF